MSNKLYKKYSTSWPSIRRHVLSSLPYMNFSKLLNILLSKFEELVGKEKISAKPYFIKIEPTNKCNLSCPGCLHAKGRKELVENKYIGDMDFAVFKKIIDSLRKYLVNVSLYFEGESLVTPKIVEMLKYLNDLKIGSVISSNFNYLPDELAKELVANKLTKLIICIDGYNEETYQKYRKGGSLKNVIKNIKKIQIEKEKNNSKYPMLEVQAINFSYYNNKEISRIRRVATDLGINNFTLKDDLTEYYDSPKPKEKKCFWLYGNPGFHWNGIVQPCCYYYDKKDNNFGDIKKYRIDEIWNNKKFRAARKYFKTGKKDIKDLRCYNCDFFKK